MVNLYTKTNLRNQLLVKCCYFGNFKKRFYVNFFFQKAYKPLAKNLRVLQHENRNEFELNNLYIYQSAWTF